MFVDVSCKECNSKYTIKFNEPFNYDICCPVCSYKPTNIELESIYQLADKFITLQEHLGTLNLNGLSSGNDSKILSDDINALISAYGSATNNIKSVISRIINLVYLLMLRDIQDSNVEKLQELLSVLSKLHTEKCNSENREILNHLLNMPVAEIDY